MNISFHNKMAWGIIIVAACLVAVWRYEVNVIQPQNQQMIASLQNDLRERGELKDLIQSFQDIRNSVERVAAQGRVDDSVVVSIQRSLTDIGNARYQPSASTQDLLHQLEADINEFLKITNQLDLYEGKIEQFTDGFSLYFQDFNKAIVSWKEMAVETIAVGGEITNTLPFTALSQRVSTLEKIIPEYDTFTQKLQSLEIGFNRWIEEINAAATIDEKQAAFGQKQYLLNGLPELFATFNGYALKTLERERENVSQIARQIGASIAAVQVPFQEQFGVRNNAVQTQITLTEYKEKEFRVLKKVIVSVMFVVLIGLFIAMAVYSFRFELGMTLFKKQTLKAARDSRQLAASVNDHTTLIIKNFDLSRTLKESLEQTSDGFAKRQLNLQHVDRLVRDTDVLIKESQESFLNIKQEFYNTEKVSQEIVLLTGALEGVAQQMTSIADRAALNLPENAQEADGKQSTIDELKYLSGRIRHAVSSTYIALDARKEKINETKARFESIEENMVQMTENTKEALRGIALARLDHSEEASRISEILENAKNTSRAIANEIDALNKQVSDFSVLGKHLDALHELAVKASALNAQSLLVEEKGMASSAQSSQRMNDHVQEYFKKIFEATAKPTATNRVDTLAADPTPDTTSTPSRANPSSAEV